MCPLQGIRFLGTTFQNFKLQQVIQLVSFLLFALFGGVYTEICMEVKLRHIF